MPYKGGVQLLPETQRRPTLASYTSQNRYFYFALFLGVAVLIASAIFGSYAASLRDQISQLDGRLDASEQQRNKQQEQDLLAASRQSRIMSQLLAGKMYWTQALQRMERMTQSGVAFTRLSASAEKGTVGFGATADSYAAVARQLAAFIGGDGVRDVTLKSVKSRPQGDVEFDGELQIDTKAMLNRNLTK